MLGIKWLDRVVMVTTIKLLTVDITNNLFLPVIAPCCRTAVMTVTDAAPTILLTEIKTARNAEDFSASGYLLQPHRANWTNCTKSALRRLRAAGRGREMSILACLIYRGADLRRPPHTILHKGQVRKKWKTPAGCPELPIIVTQGDHWTSKWSQQNITKC